MGTVCRKTSQRKDRLSWHLPLRPSPPLSLRLMPIPTTTEDTVSDTAMVSMVATGHTVLDTAVVGMARGRLRLSPRLMPIPTTTEEPTLVPDATSPTLPEPSTLPRGRLRPTPTTTEDTDTEDMVSDTGDTVSDTAVASTGVRF